MLSLLLAAGAMAVKDWLGTLLVVAEARGRDHLAGMCDAGGDIAAVGVTVVGAGAVLTAGLDGHTIALLAVMCVTSYCGTRFWTRWARRIHAA